MVNAIQRPIQFSGTTVLQSRYVRGTDIGKILVNNGGFFYVKSPEQENQPYLVVTDSVRSANANAVDTELKELAERGAERHDVPLGRVYYHTDRSNLTKQWQNQLRRRLMVDA